MGGVSSSPARTIKPIKSLRLRSKKIRVPDKLKRKKKNKDTDAGGEGDSVAVTDTTVPCHESVSSDCTHEPTHLESHTSPSATNEDEPWFDSVSSIGDSDSDDDFTSVNGDDDPNRDDEMFLDSMNVYKVNALEQVNQFSILGYQGYDGESSPTYKLGRSYSSYNGDKDDKNQARILNPQLLHSASYHDNITNTSNSGSQNLTGKPTVIKLAVKRTDTNGTRATEKLFYRPRAGFLIPCCTDEKPTPGCWSAIDPSTFSLRSENYFKYIIEFLPL
ncbi:hypothetical protein Hanom_Chr09g00826161 [Helianthus anomalus]